MTPVESVHFVKHVGRVWPQQRLEEGTPDAWYLVALKDVDLADAMEAVTNLATQKVFISLAEIVTEVKRIRALRLAIPPAEKPPAELTDSPDAYQRFIQEADRRIAGGFKLVKALPALGSGAPPTSEYDRARGVYRDPIRIAAMRVACPWPNCGAEIGSGCKTASGSLMPGRGHDARLVAAELADWSEIDGVRRLVLRGNAVEDGDR